MNLYLENGYADMHKILNLPYPFIFCVGGRGTGKTYGACRELLQLPAGERFLFMRRTAEECDMIATTEFSPFAPVVADNPEEFPPIYSGKIPNVKAISGAWRAEVDDNGILKPAGAPIGYYAALTTIHKTRGFSMETVTTLLYDEFIPEKHVHAIRAEGDAFLNAVETVGRNRELQGKKPLKVLCLSNANKLASPIFQALGIMDKVDKMTMHGKSECLLPDRGIAIIRLRDSQISAAKANTSLYKASAAGDFADMALKNDFDSTTYLYVHREPIDEYRLIAEYDGDIYIYRHKSKNWWYISRHMRGTVKKHYTSDDMSRKRMKRELQQLFDCWIRGNISFEDYYCKYALQLAL